MTTTKEEDDLHAEVLEMIGDTEHVDRPSSSMGYLKGDIIHWSKGRYLNVEGLPADEIELLKSCTYEIAMLLFVE